MEIHNRGLRAWALVAFVVGAALIVGFASADGPLAFEDDRPLSLIWEEAEKATVGVVRNVGGTELKGLRATLTGFNFKVDEEPPDEAALSVSLTEGDHAASFTLDAGAATTITVQATDVFTPDISEYAGLLVVWGPDAPLIRRQITISVPPPETNLATPKSAVGDVVLTGTLIRTNADTGDALTVTVNLDRPFLPLKQPGEGKKLPDFEKDTQIGIVYSEGHIGRVYVNGEKEKEEGVTLLPIRMEVDAPGAVGTYSGKLNLTGTGSDEEAIKIEVKVTHPEVKGAVGDIILPASRNGPFFRRVSLDSPGLPLKPSSAVETLPEFEADTHIGIVHSEGHYGHVYVHGKLDRSQEKQGMILLPIWVDDLHRVGTYSGKLYVAGTDNEEGAIAVQVEVRDQLLWAILASAFGLLIGIGLKLRMERWRPTRKLRRRADDLVRSTDAGLLEGKYGTAQTAFKTLYQGYSFGDYEVNVKEIERYEQEFGKALRAYGGSHLFFDVESDDYKNLVKALKDAEEDAHHIGHDGDSGNEQSPFGDSLRDLQTKLRDFASFLSNQFPKITKKPPFVTSAAALVDPPDGKELLAVGTAQKITTKAQGYVDLIKDWRDMAVQVEQHLLWASRIGAHPGITELDKELLQRAKAEVEDTQAELFECTDASFLSALRTAEDLRLAHDQLAYLGSRYRVWKPTRKQVIRPATKGPRAHTLANWLKAVKLLDFPQIPPPAIAKIERGIRIVGDAVVIGLAVAVAIVTVLAARYFDKTFGRNWEYVTLILIGAMAETVVTGVTDRLAQLWKTRRS